MDVARRRARIKHVINNFNNSLIKIYYNNLIKIYYNKYYLANIKVIFPPSISIILYLSSNTRKS